MTDDSRTAARDLRGLTLWNLLSLALGTAALLALLLALRTELSYDRHHANADRIYRMTEAVYQPGEEIRFAALTSYPMGPTLRQEFPAQVAEAARLMPVLEGIVTGKVAVRHGRDRQASEWFAWAEPSLRKVFDLPLVAGEEAKALVAPNTVLVSESAARRYFGGAPAVGQRLKIDTGYSDDFYEVTGVFRDFPAASHFHFDVLASFSSLDLVKDPRLLREHWWVSDVYTYVLLADGVSAAEVDAKLPAFVDEYFGEFKGARVSLRLQPATDIHLRSRLLGEIEENGDLRDVRLLAAAAGLAALFAWGNFALLSAARAARQAGRGPAAGFGRQLAGSLQLSAAAVALAAVAVLLARPALERLAGKPLPAPGVALAAAVLLALALVPALLGAAAAARAARAARPGAALGRVVVTLELAAAAALLLGALVVHGQLRLLRGHDIGLDLADVVVVPVRDSALRDRFVDLKAAMERHPGVRGTTFSSLVLGSATPQIGSLLEGVEDLAVTGTLVIDPDFLEVFGVELLAGRPLTAAREDFDGGFLINEQMLPLWGLATPQEAVGKALNWNNNKPGTVVGVVRSFHHQPLGHPVEPLILHLRPLVYRYMYLRLDPADRDGTLRALAETWRGLAPDKPFEPAFLDREYDRAYRGEEVLARGLAIGAPLALLLACLGLWGHAVRRGERRPRPLLAEAAALGLAACLLALPPALRLLSGWLAQFGERIEAGPLHAALCGLAVLAAAALTVACRSRRRPLPAAAPAGEVGVG